MTEQVYNILPFLISAALFCVAIIFRPVCSNSAWKGSWRDFIFTPVLGLAIFFSLFGLYRMGIVLLIF